MKIKQVRRNQWVVYNANGMVVVLTRHKEVAKTYVRQLREKNPSLS